MRPRIVGALCAAMVLAACGQEPTGLARNQLPEPSFAFGDPIDPNAVNDLVAHRIDSNTVAIGWTQIDDGTGSPASYRAKYAVSPMEDWKTATIGCERTITGTEIGKRISCGIDGLSGSEDYDVALMSFRIVDGVWTNALYSNTASTRETEMITDIEVAANKHSVVVTWTQVADYLGDPATYTIKWGPTPFEFWKAERNTECRNLEGTAVGEEMSCTLTELDPETEYGLEIAAYRVEAGDWMGNRHSDPVVVTTAALDAPLPVDDVDVSFGNLIAGGDTTVIVEWTQVDDGTGSPASYRVRYDTSPFLAFDSAMVGCAEVVGTAVGEPISCTITGLPSGHHVRAQVISYVAGTDGVDAKLSTIGAGFTTGAPRVTDLEATRVGSTSIDLLWTMVEDGSGNPYEYAAPTASYRVKYASPAIGDWGMATTVPGCDWLSGSGRRAFDPRTCTIEGLEPGTTYQIQLMSFQTIPAAGGGYTWGAAYYSNLIEITTNP